MCVTNDLSASARLHFWPSPFWYFILFHLFFFCLPDFSASRLLSIVFLLPSRIFFLFFYFFFTSPPPPPRHQLRSVGRVVSMDRLISLSLSLSLSFLFFLNSPLFSLINLRWFLRLYRFSFSSSSSSSSSFPSALMGLFTEFYRVLPGFFL